MVVADTYLRVAVVAVAKAVDETLVGETSVDEASVEEASVEEASVAVETDLHVIVLMVSRIVEATAVNLCLYSLLLLCVRSLTYKEEESGRK